MESRRPAGDRHGSRRNRRPPHCSGAGDPVSWRLPQAAVRRLVIRERQPMPSPFPGMDPFLEQEQLWPVFQHQFIGSLFQILLPNLVDRYRARVGQRMYKTEMPLFTSIIREEHSEEYIEVRNRADGRLVTL